MALQVEEVPVVSEDRADLELVQQRRPEHLPEGPGAYADQQAGEGSGPRAWPGAGRLLDERADPADLGRQDLGRAICAVFAAVPRQEDSQVDVAETVLAARNQEEGRAASEVLPRQASRLLPEMAGDRARAPEGCGRPQLEAHLGGRGQLHEAGTAV